MLIIIIIIVLILICCFGYKKYEEKRRYEILHFADDLKEAADRYEAISKRYDALLGSDD